MASDKFDVNGGLSVNGTTAIDANRNIFAAGATFTGSVSIGGVAVASVVSSFNGATGAVTYSPRLATSSLTGVASFGNEFVVSAAGAVSMTGNYVKTFNGATGAVVYAPPLATSSVTGVASFGNEFVVSAAGAVSLTANYVKSFNGATGTVTYAPPLATTSLTGVASFNPTNFAVSATGNVSLLAKSITASVDFGSAVDRIGFRVTGITSANHEYQFENNIGLTAYLRNAAGSVVVVGTIESSQNYWNNSYTATGATYSFPTDGLGTVTTLTYTGGIPNFFRRDADIIMRGPFTQGATTYSATDLTSLSLVVFGDSNIYNRLIPSGITGDGNFVKNIFSGITSAGSGLTFNGAGSTFGITGGGLVVYQKEESYAITTVVGQSWVTANHYIQCRVMGMTSTDHDAEDAILEGVSFEINNIVVGTGFDIIGHAPDGTYGKYTVKCIGQSV